MKINRITLLVLAIFLAFSFSNCTIGRYKTPGRLAEVTTSSLDANEDTPHTYTIPSCSHKDVARLVNPLAEKRGLVLVRNKCDQGSCKIEYSSKERLRTKVKHYRSVMIMPPTEGEQADFEVQTDTLSASSTIFITVKAREGGCYTRWVGVPVIQDRYSCPTLLEKEGECDVMKMLVAQHSYPAETLAHQWGVDISGARESGMIEGIISELEMMD